MRYYSGNCSILPRLDTESNGRHASGGSVPDLRAGIRERSSTRLVFGPVADYGIRTFEASSRLRIHFLVFASVLVGRFLQTGGPAMLRMMSTPVGEMGHGEGGTPSGHDA